ncbi:hypothetical protein [Spirillospora sp. NPDC029432]|uniref:hypothetical protein n=1 Tax=Spirillospora sp. NPDC029432 TaxID=3154599 RepID=UPI003454CDDB
MNGARVRRCVKVTASGAVPTRTMAQDGPGGLWTVPQPVAVGTAADVDALYQLWVGLAPRQVADELARDLRQTPPYMLEQLTAKGVRIVQPVATVRRVKDTTPYC